MGGSSPPRRRRSLYGAFSRRRNDSRRPRRRAYEDSPTTKDSTRPPRRRRRWVCPCPPACPACLFVSARRRRGVFSRRRSSRRPARAGGGRRRRMMPSSRTPPGARRRLSRRRMISRARRGTRSARTRSARTPTRARAWGRPKRRPGGWRGEEGGVNEGTGDERRNARPRKNFYGGEPRSRWARRRRVKQDSERSALVFRFRVSAARRGGFGRAFEGARRTDSSLPPAYCEGYMFLHLSCGGPGGGGGGRERAGERGGRPEIRRFARSGKRPPGRPGKTRGRAGRIVRAPSGRRSSADAGSWRASRPSESAATSPRRVSSRPCAGHPPPPRTTEGRDRGWVGKRVSAEKTRGDRGRRRGIQGGGSGAAGGTRPTRGRSRDARGRRTFVFGAPMTPPRGVDRGVRGRSAPRASESALGSSPPSRDWAYDETRRRRRCDSPRARIFIIWPRGGIRPLTLRFFSPRNGTASPASPPRGAPAHRTTPRRGTARPRAHRPVAAKRARGPLAPRAPDALLSRAF